MSYLKVLRENTTWVCPRSGNYLITCVAGGSGGCTNTTTHNLGGTTSFGGYLSASGSWGDGVNGVGGIPQSGINGYTFTDYATYDDRTPVSSSMNKTGNEAIGYGGGGYGGAGGGVGRINTCIAYIKSGESVVCTIGKGGAANGDESSAGNPGVITIEYIDDDVVENTQQGDSKRFSIRIYSNGSLYTTLYCPEGESIVLSIYASLVKGFSTSSTDQAIAYNLNQAITPTQNMDLYIVYKKECIVSVYYNGSLYITLKCAEGDNVTLPNISDVKGYSTSNSSSIVEYNVGQTISVNSNMSLYSIAKQTFVVTVYYNGSVYNSLSCMEGDSVTLPNISGIDGYSTGSNSTTIVYKNGGVIGGVNRNMSVYGIKVVSTGNRIVQGRPSNESLIYPQKSTITIASTQTITISGKSNGNSTVQLKSYDYGSYVKVNGSYILSGHTFWPCNNTWLSTSYQVNAGDVIEFGADSYEFIKITCT